MRSTTADSRPVEVDVGEDHDDAEVVAFRTPEGETVVFEGASPDEARAKAHDFLAWAS